MYKRLLYAAVVLWSFEMAPVVAQGTSEYGGLLGGTDMMKNGAFGLGGALKNTYGQASSNAAKSLHVIDEDEAKRYGDNANREYLTAQQALKKGDLADGLKHLNNTITYRQTVWGSNDPHMADLLKQQGDLYRKIGKFPDAINSYKKALVVENKRFGENSPQSEKTVGSICKLCEDAGDHKNLVVFLERLYSLQHRNVANAGAAKATQLKLCNALIMQGNYQKAEPMLKEALTAETASEKPDKTYLLGLYDSYGGLLREAHRDGEAEVMEKQAQALKETK